MGSIRAPARQFKQRLLLDGLCEAPGRSWGAPGVLLGRSWGAPGVLLRRVMRIIEQYLLPYAAHVILQSSTSKRRHRFLWGKLIKSVLKQGMRVLARVGQIFYGGVVFIGFLVEYRSPSALYNVFEFSAYLARARARARARPTVAPPPPRPVGGGGAPLPPLEKVLKRFFVCFRVCTFYFKIIKAFKKRFRGF